MLFSSILIALVSVFSFINSGCSSTYHISDFSSKANFYSDFNNFARGKNLKVTLRNDSSFTALQGTKIKNDSLYVPCILEKKELVTLKRNEIESIVDFYNENNNHSIKLYLKNGKELDEKSVRFLADTSLQFETKVNKILSIPIDITYVRSVTYKKNWPGILPGILVGFLSSFVVAGLGESGNSGDTGIFASGAAMFIGVPLGTLIGGIIGWLIGYNYHYYF